MRKLYLMGIIFLLISINVSGNFIKESKEISTIGYKDNILYIGGTGPNNYTLIQDAIDNATSGATLFVYNGTYYENIIINKTLSIYGENNCYIDGSYKEYVLIIISKNVLLDNLIIKNSGGFDKNCGIKINSDNNIITNCIFYRNKNGIIINDSSNNLIKNSYFHTTSIGILIKKSYKNVVDKCNFEHNSIAIHMDYSYNNTVLNSIFYTNGISAYFTQSSYNNMNCCNISNNGDNHGGIFIYNSSKMNINNSILIHNGIGIHIDDSKNVNINNCRLYLNTHFAIIIKKKSENIIITENEIANNLRFGIYLMDNCSSLISNNNFFNNSLYGLYSKGSVCNTRNNWWGSKFGPSIFEFRKADRVSPIMNIIRVKSWLNHPIEFEDLIINNENIFQYNNSENNLNILEYMSGIDTDNDGATDYWEEKWGYDPNQWNDHLNLDPDNDSLNNLEECFTDQFGSDPFIKDVFLEIDWMDSDNKYKTNKPTMLFFNRAIKNFKKHNINLHIDIGELNGGEEIPLCNLTFSFAKLSDLYWNYFLHNDLNNPRKGIFHYGIICDYCPDVSFPFMGWDQYDSYAISVDWTKSQSPIYSRQRIIAGGSLHQLGSTLGLLAETHGGNDNLGTIKIFSIQWFKYFNYKSCMNYNYKYEIFNYSDGSHGPGDFNDWDQLNLSFFKNSNFQYK